MTAPTQTAPEVLQQSVRVRSVDALRGFDMFWILGAGALVKAFEQMSDNAVTRFLSTQLEHVQWEGFVFYDLIFPLFLFLVGVSIVFSLDRMIASGGGVAAVKRIISRSILLFLFGMLHSGGLAQKWPNVGLGGVLHRIAACYLAAALIYLWWASRPRIIAVVAATLLIGYWGLLTFVPYPDVNVHVKHGDVEAIAKRIGSHDPAAIAAAVPQRVRGDYSEGRNLTNYIDFRFLPGKKAQKYYINEGLLSTLPAIAICLFGIFAGRLLKDPGDGRRKVAVLFIAGIAGVGLGTAWGLQFPVIKRIWTSSFIVVASGYSAMLLGLFYYIVDVRKWDRWCEPFVWIGMNPIALYLGANLIPFGNIAERLVGGDVNAWLNGMAQGLGGLGLALTKLGLICLVAWFLHKRRIFLRV